MSENMKREITAIVEETKGGFFTKNALRFICKRHGISLASLMKWTDCMKVNDEYYRIKEIEPAACRFY